jgi:hypothetical protein
MERTLTSVSAAEIIFEFKHFRANTHVVAAVDVVESSLIVTTTLKFLLRVKE